MKHFLPLILFVLISITGVAQSHRFADTTAQWNVVLYEDNWPPMYPSTTTITTYKVLGDTTINNILYQKINEFCLRKSSDSVIYSWDGVRDNKLYSFAPGVGDSVTGIKMSYEFTLTCRVDSIDTMQLTAVRKKMYVSCYDSSRHNGFGDIWVEGIGSLKYNSIMCSGVDIYLTHTNEYLACFMENNMMYYGSGTTCLDYTSVSEAKALDASIYPNPSSSSFSITLSQQPQPNTAILIYNTIGALVKQEDLAASIQQINIAELPNGMYNYAIAQQGIRQASGKLIISK